MKKAKGILLLGIVFCLSLVVGCASLDGFQAKTISAGETPRNTVWATAAKVNTPLGPQGLAIAIHMEAKEKELASQETTVTMPPPAPAEKRYTVPTKSPRGKKANIIEYTPAPKPQPQPQVVTTKTTYFNPNTPLGGAGGVGPGWLQDLLGKAFLATGEAFEGSFAPGTQVIQNVKATGGKGGKGGNASSSSSSAAAASAAAAAAADGGGKH